MPTETNLSFSMLLALPAALFLLFIPGIFTFYAIFSFNNNSAGKFLHPETGLSLAERLFWTLALSLFFDGWASFTLAEVGLFSLGAVLAGALIYCLILSLVFASIQQKLVFDFELLKKAVKKPEAGIQNGLFHHAQGWLLAAILLLALGLNYYAPHETIVGAQDSGIYFNAGAIIARSGGIIIKDPLLPALAAAGPKTQPQFLLGMQGNVDRFLFVSQQRFAGMFVNGKTGGLEKGEVVPQLFHFYPALLALAMSLFGLWGGLWVSPLLGVMAVFALYLAVRRLFPEPRQILIAPLAALLVALNSVQVWFSRETLWEALGEFLIFSAVYAFTLLYPPANLSGKSGGSTVSASKHLTLLGGLGLGLSLGLVTLAHSQFPFIVWVIGPYLIWVRLTRGWTGAHWALLGSFSLLLFHSVLHIRLFALGYFEGIYHNVFNDFRNNLHLLLPAAALAFFGLLVADAVPGRVLAFKRWLLGRKSIYFYGLAGLVSLYLLYSYFVRVYEISVDQHSILPRVYWSLSSYIGAPTTEGPERNLLRLGWYLSPPGIFVAILGLAAIVATRLNARTAFFLALTLGLSYIFLDFNYTQERYIYSMRRYITATIPAFSIFAAYACVDTIPALLQWGGRRLLPFLDRRTAFGSQPTSISPGPTAAIAFSLPTETRFQISREDLELDSEIPSPKQEKALRKSTSREIKNFDTSLTRWSQGIGLVLGGGLLLFLGWTGRTVFFEHEYGPSSVTGTPGVLSQLDRLASRFGPKDIVIFAGDRDQDAKISTPLTYSFNVPSLDLAYAVKNDELGDLLRVWEKQGYHFKALLGSNGGRLAPNGYTLKQTGETSIVFHQFEQLSTQKPNNVQDNILLYGIYDLSGDTGILPRFGTETGSGRVDSKEGWTLQLGQKDWPSLISGFYSSEHDPDGLSYRWTETDGTLRIPCTVPDGSAARLTLTMGGGSRPASLPPLPLKVYVSNYPYDEPAFSDPKRLQPLASFNLKPGLQDYVVNLPAGQDKLKCGDRISSLILWLAVDPSQTWVPRLLNQSNDVRRLGIKLARINLVQAPVSRLDSK